MGFRDLGGNDRKKREAKLQGHRTLSKLLLQAHTLVLASPHSSLCPLSNPDVPASSGIPEESGENQTHVQDPRPCHGKVGRDSSGVCPDKFQPQPQGSPSLVANPGFLFFPQSSLFQDSVPSRFLFFRHSLPPPLLSFPLSTVQGNFSWNSLQCVVGLGGASRGRWSREGPRQGLSHVSVPGLGKGYGHGGLGARECLGGEKQRAA